MKKVSSILIFLATLAIFGISAESFAKNRAVFSAQVNQPSAYSTIEEYRAEYDALGGYSSGWDGDSLEDARDSVENLWTWIGKFRAYFGSGDQTWTGIAWTGTYNNPKTTEIENTPTYTQAQQLYNQAIREIARLKRDYLALGGSEGEWKGTYQGIGGQNANAPTLSEAQALLIQILKTDYLARDGSAGDWTGTYDDPDTFDVVEKTPTFSEAQTLHSELVEKIQRLKTDYLARDGDANAWTGTYDDPATQDVETTPTLSEAQALVQLLKKSQSSHSPSSNNHTLIIGVGVGIGGALLLCGGLGYWFYRRRQKS